MTIDGHALNLKLLQMQMTGEHLPSKEEWHRQFILARDENARLRAALQRIADGDFPHEEGCWQIVDCSCGSNIARRALEAKP